MIRGPNRGDSRWEVTENRLRSCFKVSQRQIIEFEIHQVMSTEDKSTF